MNRLEQIAIKHEFDRVLHELYDEGYRLTIEDCLSAIGGLRGFLWQLYLQDRDDHKTKTST